MCLQLKNDKNLNIEQFKFQKIKKNILSERNNYIFALHFELILIFKILDMTKAEIVAEVANKTGVEKIAVQSVIETMMETIKGAMQSGDNVYLRGFGSFIIKERAEKTGRNISKNTTIVIPAHKIPAFKPAKTFVNEVKNNVK